ncbi:MAG: tetratricopeptide repeat protein [Candidatus Eisenbacteria bacterium]
MRSASQSPNLALRSTPYVMWVPFVLALIAYAPSLRCGLVWDDVSYIVQNPAVHSLDSLPSTLARGFGWVPGSNEAANASLLYFRPVVTAMNTLQWSASGGSAWAYHLANVLFHAAAAGALGALGVLLGLAPSCALLIAGVFAVHPAYSEAIVWVSARTDLLATLFGLASLAACARSLGGNDSADGTRRPRSITRIAPLLWVAGLLLLSLGSKESAAAIVPTCVLLLLLGQGPGLRVTGRIVAVGAASALYLASRFRVLGEHALGAGAAHEHAALPGRLLQTGVLFFTHIGRLFVPWPSTTEPPLAAQVASLSAGKAAVGLLLLAIVALGGVLLVRRAFASRTPRDVAMALGITLFLFAIVPVLQLIPTGDLYGERFLYLPAAGVFLVAGGAVEPWFRSVRRSSILLVFISAAAIVPIYSRLKDWHDDISLFGASVRVSPQSARAHAALGAALMNAGNLTEAEVHLRKGVELDPNDTLKHAQIGSLLLKTGRNEEGVKELEAAYAGGLRSATVLTNLGVGRIRQGRAEDATAVLREATELQPENLTLLEVLAIARDKAGDAAEAVGLLQRVLERDPSRKSALLTLIDVVTRASGRDAARPMVQQFLERFPDAPEAQRLRDS